MAAERAYVPAMSPPAGLMTADDLLRTHVPDKRTELVRGVLVVRERAGSRHGLVTMNLGAELADLAVEVLSPGDRPGQVLAKIADWLSAGTRLVWVLDPDRRVARIYRADGSETLVTAEGSLDGEDVLPGFACPLASIL